MKKHKWLWRAGKIMMGVGIISFMAHALLSEYLSAILPKVPDPTIGRIYALNNHGRVSYMNSVEEFWLQFLIYGFYIGFIRMIILIRLKQNE